MWRLSFVLVGMLALSANEVWAQWSSRPNILGGYNVSGPQGQFWSSSRNIFGGLDW